MATVRANVLKLQQIIDPYTKAGAEIVSGTVGSVDGDKFTKQRILDIYNDARFALANSIDKNYPRSMKLQQTSGNVYKNAAFTFSAGAATKPTDLIDTILLTDASDVVVTVLDPSLIMQARDLVSATNFMVFDYGTQFVALDGSTYVADGSDYILYYYRLPTYTLSDVTGGSTVESFNDKWYPTILQLAEAIASEQGNAAVNQLAAKLIGGV